MDPGQPGGILAALYTILMGNPQLEPAGRKIEKTRFKRWWHLVGSAVEHAAGCLVEQQHALPDEWRTAASIDFGKMFAAVEADDEEAGGVSEVLDHLDREWPTTSFGASDVAGVINNPRGDQAEMRNTLVAFFDPSGRRGGGSVTSVTVGKRLRAIVGAPVYAGGRLVKLTAYRGSETAKYSARYQVRAVGEGQGTG